MRLVYISPMKGMREGFGKSIGEIVYDGRYHSDHFE
jgi:hypothetical protein